MRPTKVVVRIDRMTDIEIESEASKREANGELEHAAELRRFAAMRRNSPERVRQILTGPLPKGFAEATHVIGTLQRFAHFCERNDAALIAGAIAPFEIAEVRGLVAIVVAWLGELERRRPGPEAA